MNERLRDITTIPNLLTAARLVYSPVMAKRLHDNPKKWWAPTAAFMLSDVVDGSLARSGDRSPLLSMLGFRRSETGRRLDPITDKVVASQMIFAGMRSGVIPKPLGAASLIQKATISALVLGRAKERDEVAVTRLGKYTEFATNLGFGTLFAAECIENETWKNRVRTTAAFVGSLGVVGAVVANVEYLRGGEPQFAAQYTEEFLPA